MTTLSKPFSRQACLLLALVTLAPTVSAMPGGWGIGGPGMLVFIAAFFGTVIGYVSFLLYSIGRAFQDGPRRLLWRSVAAVLLFLGGAFAWWVRN